MLARVTNWSKKALVVSMAALATMGYVACSEEDGADSSLNSPTEQQSRDDRKQGNTTTGPSSRFASPDFQQFSIKSVQEGYLAEERISSGLLALSSFGVSDDSSGIVFALDHYPLSEGAIESVPSTKKLILKWYDASTGFRGFVATLLDSQDALLWEYSFKNDLVVPHRFLLEERTNADELLVETLQSDSSFMEIYSQNGVVDTFFFSTNNRDSVRLIHEGLLISSLSRQSSDPIVVELNRFDANYNVTSTLVSNPNGQLVSEFLSSAIFTKAIGENVVDSSGEDVVYRISDAVCAVAGQCVMLKCAEGFIANPACDVCGVVFAACIIERFFY